MQMDVVNLDEINTSIGLMNRKPGGSGFCRYFLERFRKHDALAASEDEALRLQLKQDDALYARYRRFHEQEAFGEVTRFIAELRDYAAAARPAAAAADGAAGDSGFAITANVAYLGNNVGTHGALWGPMWGEHLDFVMAENTYRVPETGPHLLLPRGKFTAWYRLASGFTSRAPAWICPSILVPRQLAGQERTGYYLLMFLEAYANGGRWAYNWWPGVDDESRYSATVPLFALCVPRGGQAAAALLRPQFGLRQLGLGKSVELSMPHGEMLRLLLSQGLVVEDLVEIQAPQPAHRDYTEVSAAWARSWPSEEIWKARLTARRGGPRPGLSPTTGSASRRR